MALLVGKFAGQLAHEPLGMLGVLTVFQHAPVGTLTGWMNGCGTDRPSRQLGMLASGLPACQLTIKPASQQASQPPTWLAAWLATGYPAAVLEILPK